MIEVDISQNILLLYFKEGLSKREISRRLQINRKTVHRRIAQYQQFQKIPPGTADHQVQALSEYLQKGTVYDSSGRKPRKLNEQIVGQIDAYLAENARKRTGGLHKQQLRKIDIHERLEETGFAISYSSVCKYIATQVAVSQEAFIRQEYAPGSVCEFDWGEVRLKLTGTYRRFYMAVFTSAYSNYRYAILFERQNSLAFREAHILFYSHVGGVWKQMTYDNMRVAVRAFVGKTEKRPTEALQQLGRWYMFFWRFCNAAKGNEKGHVERSVEYIRRKCFAFKDDFESLQQAQIYLTERLCVLNKRIPEGSKKSAYELLQEEQPHLGVHPGKMECFDVRPYKVDKYATLCISTNRYSVPDYLVGKTVYAKCYSLQIVVYFRNKQICHHPRSYNRFEWQINLNHYLNTLAHKPGAVAGSTAMKQMPVWLRSLYKSHFIDDSKSFIGLLQYCGDKDISYSCLKHTVDTLLRRHPEHISVDHITALLGNDTMETAVASQSNEPDATGLQAMENLNELNTMMEGVSGKPCEN